MTRRLACGALLAAVLTACFGAANQPAASEPAISDEDALAFAQRAEHFYSTLSEIPLDALITFDNKDLRGYFASPSAFADYYSSLATEARESTLRDGEARTVQIREFRFTSPDEAVVDFQLRGDHERKLLFWDVKIERKDVWRRVDGVWLVFPEKL